MGEGSGRGSGRVRLFVGNRWLGRVGSTFRQVGSKKSDPWTTLSSLRFLNGENLLVLNLFQAICKVEVCEQLMDYCIAKKSFASGVLFDRIRAGTVD